MNIARKNSMDDGSPLEYYDSTLENRLNHPLTSRTEAVRQMEANGDILTPLAQTYLNTNNIPPPINKLTPDQVKEFLWELSKLSRKHNITIGGCGCCGSLYLSLMEKDDGKYDVNLKNYEHLKWVNDNDDRE